MPRRSELCSGNACEASSYRTGPWQACNATCGGGIAQREVTCYESDGVGGLRVAASGSACANVERPADVRPCNTAPCETTLWEVEGWGQCDAKCGGRRRRTATCKCAICTVLTCLGRTHLYVSICRSGSAHCDAYGWKNVLQQSLSVLSICFQLCRSSKGAAISAAERVQKCPKAPAVEEACEPCSFCDDPTQNENCNNHGVCQKNKCECEGSWKGRTCSVDASACSSGVRDVDRAQSTQSLLTCLAAPLSICSPSASLHGWQQLRA